MDTTKKFECDICNKKYKSYNTLWIHNKKFHDKKEKKQGYICNKCNKVFDDRHKKCYHQKKCNPLESINQGTINKSNNNTTINNNNSNGIINNGTINNNNNTIKQNIIINNYGNDNLEYISENFKLNLFNNLLKLSDHQKPIPRLIENIKFNPNHKENNNVKITSDRSKIGFYYNNNKWKAVNKDYLLNDMCDCGLKIFKKFFEEYKDKLSDDIKQNYENFLYMTKIKSDLRKEMTEKIENIAYIFTINNEDKLDN